MLVSMWLNFACKFKLSLLCEALVNWAYGHGGAGIRSIANDTLCNKYVRPLYQHASQLTKIECANFQNCRVLG